MRQLDLAIDGYCNGPLFHIRKRRMPKRYGNRLQGMLRRQSEKRATPSWADRAAIRRIYKRVKEQNKLFGYQAVNVDHIVPLQHPLVCGLHVENNLRIVTRKINAEKSNLYWPDMPCEQGELLLETYDE